MSNASRKDPQVVEIKDCDGETLTFRITPFAGVKAYEYMPDVLDLVGGPIANLLDGLDHTALKAKVSEELDDSDPDETDTSITPQGGIGLSGKSLAEAIRALSDFMRSRGTGKWVQNFLHDTYLVEAEGTSDKLMSEVAHFNRVFQADMILLVQLLFHVIRINYGGSLGNSLGGVTAKLKSLVR